jgi:hypothetical protein
MDGINGLRAFDSDEPVLSEPRSFVVRPSSAGGFEACAAALSRLLASAMDEGLWWATTCLAEPHPNPGFAHLGPDARGCTHPVPRPPHQAQSELSRSQRDGDHAQGNPPAFHPTSVAATPVIEAESEAPEGAWAQERRLGA